MIQEAITKLLDRKQLARAEARAVMDEIMRGEATPAQIGGFLIALRSKGVLVCPHDEQQLTSATSASDVRSVR